MAQLFHIFSLITLWLLLLLFFSIRSVLKLSQTDGRSSSFFSCSLMMMSARSKSKNREGSLLFPSLLLLLLRMGLPVQTLQTLHSLWQIVVIIIISCWNYNCPVVDNSVAVHHCLGFLWASKVWLSLTPHTQCPTLTWDITSFCAVVFLLFIEVNLIARWWRHTVAATVWQVRTTECERWEIWGRAVPETQCNFSHLQDCVFFFFFTFDSLFSLALFNCLWVACLSV